MRTHWQRALGLGLAAVSTHGQKNWAVIVAGSNGFWNYRHQVGRCLLRSSWFAETLLQQHRHNGHVRLVRVVYSTDVPYESPLKVSSTPFLLPERFQGFSRDPCAARPYFPFWRVLLPASYSVIIHIPIHRCQSWTPVTKFSCTLPQILQADVCHAFHVVRRNGIPEERVILMSYGDVADSVDNPVRGSLYKWDEILDKR